LRPIFSKKTPKFALSTIRFCSRLLEKFVQKVSQKLTAQIMRFLTIEVERKVFFLVDNKVWPPLVQNFLNYSNLGFCTISMHIMLGTYVLNLRGRGWVEHTQMHIALKKGTKNFHCTSEFTFALDKNPNGCRTLILAKKLK
jgi:hypothetical protein